ncbi:hypothetical protein [Prevotella nigrescens]|uniref:hypothetical protein n=1 Tax=Prevotella nigrescens TaxID=28133 RepID=UPI00211B33E6|nr:hypothetical protein [Prevotella nigrescens]
MMKRLRLIQMFLLLFLAVGTYAVEPISGYFRIRNAHTRADGKQYVQVTGKYQAQPNQTADAVKTQPGSVIQLEAKWDNAKNRYIVTTLRSQGVDVINGYLLKAIEMFKNKIDQKLKDNLGTGEMYSKAKRDIERILAQWDLDMHLEKTATQNGVEAYYAYATVPSMQPIVDYYNNSGNLVKWGINYALSSYKDILDGLKHNNANEVWKAVEKYAMQLINARFGADSDLAKVVKYYFDNDRINHGQTYYLMEGNHISKTEENGHGVNKYVEGEAKFDFCNNNTKDEYYGPELPVAGDAAKWFLEPVTNEAAHYFGVAPANKMKGKNGKYFTTLYTDFPMKIVDNMNAYIVESIGTTGAEKGYAQCKKIASKNDIIPAQTPIVLECETTASASNRLLPLANTTPAPTNNILKAVFFDEAKNTIETAGKTVRVFNINPKPAVRNPLGFYRYSGTIIKGNRAFLLVDANASGSKLDGYDMEEEGTADGIDEVTTTTVETATNAVYYDLQGRRVDHPVRGIYIVNGKKVIIK